MANTKISDMAPGSALVGPELFEMEQSGGTVSTTAAAQQTLAQVSPQYRLFRVVTAAGAITVTSADFAVLIKKSVGAASAVALPVGVGGMEFIIKDSKGDAAANNITITPASGTIDGAGTLVISTNYGHVRLMHNGTEWGVM